MSGETGTKAPLNGFAAVMETDVHRVCVGRSEARMVSGVDSSTVRCERDREAHGAGAGEVKEVTC